MSFDLKIKAGDLQIKNGAFETLIGIAKLKQDIVKIATTELGSDPLNSWYGSMISQSLIGNVLPDNITYNIAESQLQNAIETLKQLQELQAASGQKVSPDELISYIRNISIQRSDIDPRAIQVIINVLNKTFGTVKLAFDA